MKYTTVGLWVLILSLFWTTTIVAQEDSELVEVYGLVVVKNTRGALEYVPFVTVSVVGATRGTYANYEGMYSLVVKKGQTIRFSAIGFEDREMKIPTDINGLYHSLTVELKSKPIDMKEITVFPWPDRNNLTAEFLALQPNRSMQLASIAKENLDRNALLAIAAGTIPDGKESASHYLRQQTSTYSYTGQLAPQAIGDPLAWIKFFQQMSKKEGLSKKEKKMIELLDGENE